MKVEQVYDIVNTMTKEVLGEETVVQEDLSNIVEVGKAFENLGDQAVDNYVRKLHDHIGKVVFVNRIYTGRAPSVLMDGWEYGSILEKVRAKMPEATENESWQLVDGTSYDPNIFTAPEVSVKFFNKRTTFEIPLSTTDKQVKSSFSSAAQLNGFYSMIETALQNSMTVKTDELVMRTINNAIAETIYDSFPGGNYNGSTNRAVNLLYLYNQTFSQSLDAETAIRTPEFIRFAAQVMADYIDRMQVISTLFNIEGTEKFTSKDRMHIVMHSQFRRAAEIYLQSNTFHDDLVKYPNAESVVYWQGSGLTYAFEDTSSINVKTSNNHTVDIDGVLGVVFDRDCLGVSNVDRRITSYYNAKAEFWNEWHKFDAGYFNDFAENCVVFFAK